MMRCLFALLVVVSLGGEHARAQSLDAVSRDAGAFYKYVDDPSDITIEVKVWGSVINPGLYEVRQGLKLSTLLSLAGGPQFTERNLNTSNNLTLRLYRAQPSGQYQVILETRMENEILALNQDPVLQHGDMLVADEQMKQRFSWREGLTIITALASVGLLIERLASSN